jgi:hypothetical protein
MSLRAGLAMITTIFAGSLTCSSAAAEVPPCRGGSSHTIDLASTGHQPTRESAAARGLEVTFGIDVRQVELTHDVDDRYIVMTIDGVALADPPTVVIERVERGSVPVGVLC